MQESKFDQYLGHELKTIIIKITDPICDLLEEVENKFIEFKRRNYNIIKACQKNNNIS